MELRRTQDETNPSAPQYEAQKYKTKRESHAGGERKVILFEDLLRGPTDVNGTASAPDAGCKPTASTSSGNTAVTTCSATRPGSGAIDAKTSQEASGSNEEVNKLSKTDRR